MLIVLDAGHGGSDSGAIGFSNLLEKDVVLKVTLILAELLEKLKIDVLLTRNNDSFIPLTDRSEFANTNGADYFISIHANAATTISVSGVETYAYSTSGKSYLLAQDVQKHLVSATGFNNRGVKTANFYVLRETKMPAILIEIGFISNPIEEQHLKDDNFIHKIAFGIYEGIAEYLNLKISTEHLGQSAIYKLKELGIISELHDADNFVTWGEFATIILQIMN
ncbi:N-acetylmuramoyl-L-alanine amidase [Candidatus Epulonipiscioides gigas]|nr:N-acetylmuramoyl-L-alanine amidase [Epulopiscium sp. SCG-C07WGA-EpuloA2]